MTAPPNVVLHAWQSDVTPPPQDELQHTPSTQFPEPHWELVVQTTPRPRPAVMVTAVELLLLFSLDSETEVGTSAHPPTQRLPVSAAAGMVTVWVPFPDGGK